MNSNIKNASDLRNKFLSFMETKGHSIIHSASVIPENDPTVLFTTAGMHPLVPYLLGEKHPMGTRLTDVQKCIRTGDIDEVGDDTHCTFFEMLGNWSLGDYFKKEAINWAWEFLTSEQWLGIDKKYIAVSVFEGDADAPRDDEAANLWKECGVDEKNIFYLPKKKNWWGPAGITGPCGPDTEIFIVKEVEDCSPDCSPACDCGKYLEIWNNVFMQYYKNEDGSFGQLQQKNVDTGMGLERTLGVLIGAKNVYQTDLFSNIISKISELSGVKYYENDENTKSFRIIADHIRTSTIILGDERGVNPSNVDQGYILRRLIRRAIRHGKKINLPDKSISKIAEVVIEQYREVYPELVNNKDRIIEQLDLEEDKFNKTLKQGIKEFDKLVFNLNRIKNVVYELKQALNENKTIDDIKIICSNIKRQIPPKPEYIEFISVLEKQISSNDVFSTLIDNISKFENKLCVIDGRNAFKLFDTFGFPIEITNELANENGYKVDNEDFKLRFKEHQEKSHAGAEQRFKGGLADSSEETAKLHTATHLLQAALRRVLGEEVSQKGSNITAERLRFDFSFNRKVTKEELDAVEKIVNDWIEEKVPVICEEMPLEEAKKQGALGLFENKYAEKVKVYTIGKHSKEICGGPHAKNTGDLKQFKIRKEEASSAGVRRIKAIITS